MSDPWVENTQKWLQQTYGSVPGWVPLQVTGSTGWLTMYALTRALQRELGITTLSDAFGPGTMSALQTYGSIGPSTANKNIVRIVQGAMYCKGYNGGNGQLDGVYGSVLQDAVQHLTSDIGIASVTTVAPKVFKALLTMDAYVLLSGGSPTIRVIQRDFNRRYWTRRDFQLVPADGLFSRGVQTALLYSLQYEIGMADGTANGVFGPGTQSGLKSKGAVAQGSTDGSTYFVHLFQAALTFNSYTCPYDGTFSSSVTTIVKSFQSFAALSASGKADYPTWASLLVSTGDPTRPATAVDCVTTITAARAATLFGGGYRIVGRYLTNTSNNIPDKNIKPGELDAIFKAGLKVFPIFETGGWSATHFTNADGANDAQQAHDAAVGFGFRRGTTIYYTVDFDALDADVDTKIIPYFQGVYTRIAGLGSRYRIGIYGARNICRRLASAGLTTSSFVSGLSTGFSGNLGFPLPSDWAFDQIATVTLGSGSGQIEIDRNVASSRQTSQSSVTVEPTGPKLDVVYPTTINKQNVINQIMTWLGQKMTAAQQAASLLGLHDAAQLIFDHDAAITRLARGYRMRKALIQTVLVWESACINPGDTVQDTRVRTSFHYKEQLEYWNSLSPAEQASTQKPTEPLGAIYDSSTGSCQVTSKTAIGAITYGRGAGLTNEPARTIAQWHDVWAVWQQLSDSLDYNLTQSALVLLQNASIVGSVDNLAQTISQTTKVLSKYNGDDSYGERNYGLYSILESINSAVR